MSFSIQDYITLTQNQITSLNGQLQSAYAIGDVNSVANIQLQINAAEITLSQLQSTQQG